MQKNEMGSRKLQLEPVTVAEACIYSDLLRLSKTEPLISASLASYRGASTGGSAHMLNKHTLQTIHVKLNSLHLNMLWETPYTLNPSLRGVLIVAFETVPILV